MRPLYWGLIVTMLGAFLGMLLLVMYSQGMFEMVCPRCHGKGYIANISRIDLNGESVIIRNDEYLRITATFYNEGDENASVPVHAYIEYEGEIFDEKTTSWNFPSTAYTTVTLDLHASATHTAKTYDMNVPSKNRVIACPVCWVQDTYPIGKGYVPNWDAVKLVVIATLAIIIILSLLPFPFCSEVRER